MASSAMFCLKIVMAGESFALEVPSSSSIDQLKEAIFGKSQLSPANQQLIFRGKKLETGSLEQNKLTKKATLMVREIKSEKAETKEEKGEAVLCQAGCGFWGNTLTDSMCSKCYNERKSAEKPVAEKPAAEKPSEKPQQDTPMADAPPPVPEVVQEHPTRCYKCNKRVGYTIIKCRCGYSFCGKHRYSDQHDCPYDYKVLTVKGEKVEADKIRNRIK